MKLLNFLKSIFAFFILSLVFSSCAEDSPSSINVGAISTTLNVFNNEYSYYNYGSGKVALTLFGVDKEIETNGLTIDSEANFLKVAQEFINHYNIDLDDISEIKSICIYGKKASLTIDENITGFSVIINNGGSYQHLMFEVKNDIAISLNKFNKNYSTGILSETFGNFSYKLNKYNTYYLLVRNPKKNNNNHREFEKFAIDKMLLEQYPIIITYQIASTHYCSEAICSSTDIGFCTELTDTQDSYCGESSYITDGPWCPEDEDELIVDPDHDRDYSTQRTAMYNIRDQILSLSNKGTQYKDFYYKLGYVFKVTDIYNVQNGFYSTDIKYIMDFIRTKSTLFWTATNSGVLISSSEALSLKQKITKFRNLTTNVEYQSIMSTLSNDLDYMTNKPKSDILNYMTH